MMERMTDDRLTRSRDMTVAYEWLTRLKLLFSSLAWIAAALWGCLLVLIFSMESLHMVIKLEQPMINLIFETAFPVLSIVVFAQLFAKEWEHRLFRWLMTLPFNPIRMFFGRWLAASAALAVVYWGSLAIIDIFAVPLTWQVFTYRIAVPSLFLGTLGLFGSVIGGRVIAGLGIGLFYCCFEQFAQGRALGSYSLFLSYVEVSDNEMGLNRLLYVIASIILLLGAMYGFSRRYWHEMMRRAR
jgi:hypothetical protein